MVAGQVLFVLCGFALNNATLADSSGYRIIVPIAVVAFLGAIGVALLSWQRQPNPFKALSICVVLASVWQLQDAVLRRLPALFDGK